MSRPAEYYEDQRTAYAMAETYDRHNYEDQEDYEDEETEEVEESEEDEEYVRFNFEYLCSCRNCHGICRAEEGIDGLCPACAAKEEKTKAVNA